MIGTVEIHHGATPPSMNNPASGFKSRHWAQGHRTKRTWQQVFEMLLMASELPRGCERIVVDAVLIFPKRRRRDAENYLPLLSKSFGDAAVNGRWIPDDTPEHYRFKSVQFGHGSPETVLIITYEVD